MPRYEKRPGEAATSRTTATGGVAPVTKTTIAERLRKLEERFAHELMLEEERLELLEKILKLRKKIETTAGRA